MGCNSRELWWREGRFELLLDVLLLDLKQGLAEVETMRVKARCLEVMVTYFRG